MKTAEAYVPYGEEWKNELMKLSKIHIISMYRSTSMALQEMKYSNGLPSLKEKKCYESLEKINSIVESDIPVPKFILALLQIKKHVKETGYF